jgi:predicted  nucleic acid-binding Zn-ribbon protein
MSSNIDIVLERYENLRKMYLTQKEKENGYLSQIESLSCEIQELKKVISAKNELLSKLNGETTDLEEEIVSEEPVVEETEKKSTKKKNTKKKTNED